MSSPARYFALPPLQFRHAPRTWHRIGPMRHGGGITRRLRDMPEREDLPILTFASRAAWAAWLADNHAMSDGLWLKIAKKGRGIDSVSYPEAVEAALCYGWIDGQKDTIDDDYWLQRFTPRRAR